ncbi:hypothetical protein OBBRIDRAFT_64617 [Obba rivulosa]|uniref:Uncharacterized protein n=1 Tax=Obba rivulosa TaxID=1052685 RepID=A0A8E2AT01_9APHY|nr:hypothetical protein OBBRIDRAFT_64617 [Obba rivulosa]
MASSCEFRPQNIYAEQLSPLGHGLPLWHPSPTGCADIHLYDVGRLDEHGFTRIFNPTFPVDHELNRYHGVPQGHRLLVVDDRLRQMRPQATGSKVLLSRSLRHIEADGSSSETGLICNATDTTGALLLLPEPATQEILLPSPSIANYMRQNYRSWLDLAEDRMSLDLRMADLVFVRGYCKTTEWTVAAFDRSDTYERVGSGELKLPSMTLSLPPDTVSAYQSGPRLTVGKDGHSLTQPSRSYLYMKPQWSTSEESVLAPEETQCVFLNYYKIKARSSEPIGANIISSGRSGIKKARSLSESYCPVKYVLDYILQHSNAEVAVAHDGDITILCEGRAFPGDLTRFLENVAPAITVDENGMGMLAHNHSTAAEETEAERSREHTIRILPFHELSGVDEDPIHTSRFE